MLHPTVSLWQILTPTKYGSGNKQWCLLIFRFQISALSSHLGFSRWRTNPYAKINPFLAKLILPWCLSLQQRRKHMLNKSLWSVHTNQHGSTCSYILLKTGENCPFRKRVMQNMDQWLNLSKERWDTNGLRPETSFTTNSFKNLVCVEGEGSCSHIPEYVYVHNV